MLLSQPTQVVQLQTPQAVPTHVITVPTLAQDRSISVVTPVTASPVVAMTLQNSTPEDDVSFYMTAKHWVLNWLRVLLMYFVTSKSSLHMVPVSCHSASSAEFNKLSFDIFSSRANVLTACTAEVLRWHNL